MPTWVRASAEMMPWVTVCPTPKGLPIASTTSPTRRSSELAKSSVGNLSWVSFRRSTARSEWLSLSTISASNSRLSESETLTWSAPSMTWTLVTTRPDGSTITPGSQRTLHLLGLLAGHAEEASEDRIVEQRVVVLHHLGGIDVDHRRLHALHDRRVGEPQLRRRGRHAAVLGERRAGYSQIHQQCRENANSGHKEFPRDGRSEYRLPGARIEVREGFPKSGKAPGMAGVTRFGPGYRTRTNTTLRAILAIPPPRQQVMSEHRRFWPGLTGEPPHEGRRVQKITAGRCGRCIDRFRDRQTGTAQPRHPRRREGDLGQSGRLQGPQARRTARGRDQDSGL